MRKIPHKGIGYRILRYQAQQDIPKPELVFNYLGQFDHEIQTDVFQISHLSTGEVISPDAETWYNIAFEGMMRQGKLHFEIRYNSDAYHESTIKAWSDRFITCLEDLIEHCIQKEETEKTPSDYGDPSLDLEELATIQANVEGEYERIYPLTPMQEGMLYHMLLDSQSKAYFEQFAFWVEGALDIACLEKSYLALIERYDVFRTQFVYEGLKHPRQVVLTNRKDKIQVEDLSHVANLEEAIERLQEEDRELGFDLTNEVPIRVRVCKLRDEQYVILWSFHHILMDGWCISIVVKEMLEIYQALKEGRKARLSHVEPYSRFMEWLDEQDRKKAGKYWEGYLSGYEQQSSLPKSIVSKDSDASYERVEEMFVLKIKG